MEKPELYKDLHQEEDAPEYDDGREEGCTEEYDEETGEVLSEIIIAQLKN